LKHIFLSHRAIAGINGLKLKLNEHRIRLNVYMERMRVYTRNRNSIMYGAKWL